MIAPQDNNSEDSKERDKAEKAEKAREKAREGARESRERQREAKESEKYYEPLVEKEPTHPSKGTAPGLRQVWAERATRRRSNLARASRMIRQGIVGTREIADALKVGTATAKRYKDTLAERWAKEASRDYTAHVSEQLQMYQLLMAESYQAFNNSKGRHVRTTVRHDGDKPIVTEVTEERTGDAKYLAIIDQCIMGMAKLTGTLVERRQDIDDEGDVIGSAAWFTKMSEHNERILSGTVSNVIDAEEIKRIVHGEDDTQ